MVLWNSAALYDKSAISASSFSSLTVSLRASFSINGSFGSRNSSDQISARRLQPKNAPSRCAWVVDHVAEYMLRRFDLSQCLTRERGRVSLQTRSPLIPSFDFRGSNSFDLL